MAHDVRSIRDRAKQLLALQQRGIVDRKKQAQHMGLSFGHVSRIRGWVREHHIGDEETERMPGGPSWLKEFEDLSEQFHGLTSTQLTVRVSKDRVESLRAYCEKNSIKIDSAVDLAIEHYLKTRPR